MTKFELNGVTYESNEKGNYFYRSTGKTDKQGNPFMARIGRQIFEKAYEEYKQAWDTEEEIRARKEAEERKQKESDRQTEEAMNGKTKKAARPRKSKDIALELDIQGQHITLTAKQVDFINHIPDTCFYENGLESTPWCDVLADEIGGQFANKPMTVGAMISTLREKGVIFVMTDKINGKKAKFFGFTDLGKEVAFRLGLR